MLQAPFSMSVGKLLRTAPNNTDIKYFGGLRIDAVRLLMVNYAIENGFSHILMLDDDMIFPDNLLTTLLRHAEEGKRVVSGLYGAKSPPFHWFLMPITTKGHVWKREGIDHERVYEVKSIATGCLLIDLSIFEKLAKPYFLLRMDTFGRITKTEDCYFAANCLINGIKMYVDAGLVCQHLKLVAIPNMFKSPFINRALYKDGAIINVPLVEKDEPNFDPTLDREYMHITPVPGLNWTDGVDDCIHAHQILLPYNEGQLPLYKCLDCGLITRGPIQLTTLLKEEGAFKWAPKEQ